MILIVNGKATEKQMHNLLSWIDSQHLQAHISKGDYTTIVGLVGDTSHLDIEQIRSIDIVQDVRRVSEPYKKANRKFHPKDTVIRINDEVSIGGPDNFTLMAGPCSVENEEQIIGIARSVKASGAQILRGGAFKPRTSPYSFQGLGADGIRLLLEAKKETGLPIVTELMSITDLPLFEDVDIIQIGARNMQNFNLLKEVGKTNKPILLKRGLANTLRELLMSAEYIMSSGNENVILCERGIRTFETAYRNTLDVTAVPKLHECTHLPVIVDPSHSTGQSRLVKSVSMAAAACGANGLIIEVHNDPPHALCDGAQSLRPEQFADVAKAVRLVRSAAVEAGICHEPQMPQ